MSIPSRYRLDPEAFVPGPTSAARLPRLPVLVAIAMVGMLAVVLPVALGFPAMSVVGGMFLVCLLTLTLKVNNSGAPGARVAAHATYFFSLVVLTYAVFATQVSPIITAYIPGPMLLAAANMLGARAALLWTVPTLALVAAGVLVPPPDAQEVAPLAQFVARGGALVTTVAFGVAFRQAYDLQAAKLVRNATTDPLTGLPNRRALSLAIRAALQRSARFARQGALVWIDIDGLKRINDTHGHEAGDALIQIIAGRIDASIRGVDTVARMGGDEFVVLLSEYDVTGGAAIFVRRLLSLLCEPCVVAGETIHPSASIGVAHFPSTATEPTELLQRADEAMYSAKRAGGGRIVTSPS